MGLPDDDNFSDTFSSVYFPGQRSVKPDDNNFIGTPDYSSFIFPGFHSQNPDDLLTDIEEWSFAVPSAVPSRFASNEPPASSSSIAPEGEFEQSSNSSVKTYETTNSSIHQEVPIFNHRKRVPGLQRFVCTYAGCSQVWATLDGLRRHLSTHDLKKHERDRFICPSCGKCFAHPKDLKRHQFRYHDHELWQCFWQDCRAAFGRRDNAVRHLRVKHHLSASGDAELYLRRSFEHRATQTSSNESMSYPGDIQVDHVPELASTSAVEAGAQTKIGTLAGSEVDRHSESMTDDQIVEHKDAHGDGDPDDRDFGATRQASVGGTSDTSIGHNKTSSTGSPIMSSDTSVSFMTETESSTSEESEELLPSSEDIKDAVVDRLMRIFCTWWFSCLSSSHTTHGGQPRDHGAGQRVPAFASLSSIPQTEQTAQNNNWTSFSRKRAVSIDRQEEDGEDDEPPRRRQKRPRNLDQIYKLLACPFFKRDQRSCRGKKHCSGPGWDTIARLKEHLYRCHVIHKCQRCGSEYDSEKDLSNHIRAPEQCLIKPLVWGMGIDPPRWRKLHSKGGNWRKLNDVEKWRSIYVILFPDEESNMIPSPYYDYGSEDIVAADQHEQFLRIEIPGRVRHVLQTRIDAALEPIRQQLEHELLEIIQLVHSQFLQTRGVPSERDAEPALRTTTSEVTSQSRAPRTIGLLAPFPDFSAFMDETSSGVDGTSNTMNDHNFGLGSSNQFPEILSPSLRQFLMAPNGCAQTDELSLVGLGSLDDIYGLDREQHSLALDYLMTPMQSMHGLQTATVTDDSLMADGNSRFGGFRSNGGDYVTTNPRNRDDSSTQAQDSLKGLPETGSNGKSSTSWRG